MAKTSVPSLKRALLARHLTMMSVGAVIGAGYLLGAGAAINAAGPAVIVSYALGGLVALLVVALLAEMAAAVPAAGRFSSTLASPLAATRDS